jgi:hypothetical protein
MMVLPALLKRCAAIPLAGIRFFPEDSMPAQEPTIFVAVRQFIERPQGVHYVIKAHKVAGWCRSKIGRGLDGARGG